MQVALVFTGNFDHIKSHRNGTIGPPSNAEKSAAWEGVSEASESTAPEIKTAA